MGCGGEAPAPNSNRCSSFIMEQVRVRRFTPPPIKPGRGRSAEINQVYCLRARRLHRNKLSSYNRGKKLPRRFTSFTVILSKKRPCFKGFNFVYAIIKASDANYSNWAWDFWVIRYLYLYECNCSEHNINGMNGTAVPGEQLHKDMKKD